MYDAEFDLDLCPHPLHVDVTAEIELPLMSTIQYSATRSTSYIIAFCRHRLPPLKTMVCDLLGMTDSYWRTPDILWTVNLSRAFLYKYILLTHAITAHLQFLH